MFFLSEDKMCREQKNYKKTNYVKEVILTTQEQLVVNWKYVKVKMNGRFIKLQLDTGSDITVINKKKKIMEIGTPEIEENYWSAWGASGKWLNITGTINCNVSFWG